MRLCSRQISTEIAAPAKQSTLRPFEKSYFQTVKIPDIKLTEKKIFAS
jgi:hypothetical protein